MGSLRKLLNGFRRAGEVIRAEVHRRPGETRENYRRRMAFFVGPMLLPFICYSLLCLAMFMRSGEDGLKEFGALLAGDWLYFLPGAGKITAIPMMIEADLAPALVAASTVFLDTLVAFFVAFNFSYIQRFPISDRFVGFFLRESEAFLERHHWIRKISFLALVFYVMLPFKGSGGIGGTVLGMVIGLGRLKTWLAILTGSTIASFSLAYSAAAARAYLIQVRQGGYLVLAFFITIALYISYKNRKSRAATQARPARSSEYSIEDSIHHAGEARPQRERFAALDKQEQNEVVEFLKQLHVLPLGSPRELTESELRQFIKRRRVVDPTILQR